MILSPISPLTKKHQTYQPRLYIFLLPTNRCRGWKAETGVSRTGCLGCRGQYRGGMWMRKHTPVSAPQQHARHTWWLWVWREKTWKPATVMASGCHPHGLYKRSKVTSWQTQPAFINWHYDQGCFFNAGHCWGEKQADNNRHSDQRITVFSSLGSL